LGIIVAVEGPDAGGPGTDGIPTGSGHRRTVLVVVALVVVAAVLTGAVVAALRAPAGQRVTARWSTPPPKTTAPYTPPSQSPFVSYPGQPYPVAQPLCAVVDQNLLVPALYSERTRYLDDDIADTVIQLDFSKTFCVMEFDDGLVNGAYQLMELTYANPSAAARQYDVQRNALASEARTYPAHDRVTTRDVPGLGQKAFEMFKPQLVSDQSNVHIQPQRGVHILVLDANVVLYAQVVVQIDMGATFTQTEQQLKDAAYRALRDNMAKLRAGGH
jgi:hypothetical protein